MNILDLLYGVGGRPIGGVSDIPKSPPPSMLGGNPVHTENIGEVGANPFAGSSPGGVSDIQKSPLQGEFGRGTTPGGRPIMPSFDEIFSMDQRPSAGQNTPSAGLAASAGGGAPAPAAAPASGAPRSDGRDTLRDTARALIQHGSPAQKVQGIQMLFEANQATPEEKAEAERARVKTEQAAERQRLIQALDEDQTMTPEMKARARMAIQLGAKPDDVLKMATGDDKATSRGMERNERLTKWQLSLFSDEQELGNVAEFAKEAVALIDNGTMTTGLGGWFGQLAPGSDANRLATALEPIQRLIGVDQLTRLREESKTGGALGNVSNAEGQWLSHMQGALDPVNTAPETLKANIAGIVRGKELFAQMRALIPALDAGDPEAHAQASQLSREAGKIAAGVRQRAAAKGPQQPQQQAAPQQPPRGPVRGPDGNMYEWVED